MASTSPYRRSPSQDDSGGVCDICFLLLVPCFPIGRAQVLAGSSLAWAVLVAALVAVLYSGGLAAFAMYTTYGFDALTHPHNWKVFVYGWVLYAIGPVLDVPVLIFGIWLSGAACDFGDCERGDRERAQQQIPWFVGAVLLFMSVVAIALLVRASLVRRFQIPKPETCGSSCWVACTPLCCVARTMMAARKAYALEHQAQHDELPAYIA